MVPKGEVFCQFQTSITSYVEALEKGKNRDSSTDEDSFPSTQQFQPMVPKGEALEKAVPTKIRFQK